MEKLDPTLLSSALDRFCQSSTDPLALVDETGRVCRLNAAMRKKLVRHSDPVALVEAFCQSGHLDKQSLPTGDAKASAIDLVKLTLGNICLVTCVEHNAESRIQRLKQKLEQAEKQSITDRLTGAWNRQQFDQLVRREIVRSRRYGEPLCLAVLDIDYFKRINDEHGHAAGDQILRALVALMQSQIRVVDSLFRWGGEEFAVLLPHSSLSGARLAAERLRTATAAHHFPPAGSLTISVGVAELGSNESAEDWFKRADEALYRAKHAGRNRVVCSSSNGVHSASGSGGDSVVFLPWKTSYECGHAMIDRQHQQLFALGNRLIAASLDPDTSRADFLGCADELIAHVQQHFADEEQLLAKVGYEELEAHQRAHAALLKKAMDLRHKAENATVASSEVIDYLANSVVKNHMLTADKDFFGHLTSPD